MPGDPERNGHSVTILVKTVRSVHDKTLGDDGGSALTYSIVARDALSGDLGVAVQTCMFAVGSTVPWPRPGIGAVATQAITEAAYGPRCLDRLALGATATEALAAAQAADPMPALRQVGVVSSDGSVAVTTGELCIDHAGEFAGDGFVVQANMMSTPDVWPAMASTFAGSSGALAHRLLAALKAGNRRVGTPAVGCLRHCWLSPARLRRSRERAHWSMSASTEARTHLASYRNC